MGNTIPHTIRELEFEGPLQEPIQNFVEEKRRLGNLYNAEAYLLRELSRIATSENCPRNVLTKELVHLWTAKKPTNSTVTHRSRCSIVRQLGQYMVRTGYDAYIASLVPINTFKKMEFTPYIFSDDELCRFFAAIDAIQKSVHSPYQHLTFPLLFRLLYGCGLRLNEALTLKIEDVDLAQGVLSIRGTKFGKDRLVPMVPSLVTQCAAFMDSRHTLSSPKELFLPAPDGGIYSHTAVYRRYRDTLWTAGISYGGRSHGPRIHDFRHTFSVHCLRNWMRSGMDVENALPYLSAYLGHVNTQATHTYLRLTAELFPEIVTKAEAFAGHVIPHLEVQDL
ncbi:tyrosine-type recombinase/integrase [Acutalibacter muris]|jgi:integrase|uniref:tyrosine-type recombinase/integrase n=1 Tax=Acutalibacter muris TaxID=1796620 RepID=UPI0026F39063|nr:tyrosine-type recombinase/integrase [Acutalibacter muris]